MYVTRQAVEAMEQRYGVPSELRLTHAITGEEMALVRSSQKHGRAHDVTLFIFRGDQLALIRKPSFPPAGFRAPSGGVEPGESIEAGALREAYEETGLRVRLERYLLRVHVRFTSPGDQVDWTSHVFQASAQSGELGTLDPREIAETRWATVAELQGAIRDALQATGRALLAYRILLTDAVVPLLSLPE